MSNSFEPAPSLEGERQKICLAFESAWQNGGSPSINDFLRDVEATVRPHLLRDLLRIDIKIRQQCQSSRTRSSYEQEFPEHREIIADVFDAFGKSETVDYSLKAEPDTQTPHDDGHAPTVVPHSSGDSHSEPFVRHLGDYELLHEIARGGMGVVFKARQKSLNRIVALKMIKAGELANTEEVRRFHAEAEAAAKLDHPQIVPIYEVGEDMGRHYFSMGFVDGEGLNSKLKDGPLPEREATALTQKIAVAVHYAHERGIVHRDLKPSNVLIDSYGEPRVTDFGLAKMTAMDSSLTATGQVMGTPSYMPPEQASGSVSEIGPLSDVYSLGAMLYCLLTGRPPFQAANVVDTLRQVLDQDPVSPRGLNAAVSKDLETVCLKCLEKHPWKRFSSAAELAEELSRHLRGEPIHSRPVSRIERFRRWCLRKPMQAALSLTVLGLLLVLLVGGGWYNTRLRGVLSNVEQKNRTILQNNTTIQQERGNLQSALQQVEQQNQVIRRNNETIRKERDAVRKQLAESYLDQGLDLCEAGNCSHGLLLIARSLTLLPPNEPELEFSIRTNLRAWCERINVLQSWLTHPDGRAVESATYSPDGKSIATGAWDGTVRIWDAETGALKCDEIRQNYRVLELAFGPEGKTLLVRTGTYRGLDKADLSEVRLWNIHQLKPLHPPIEHPGRIMASALSPDGKTIVTGGTDRTVRFWDSVSGNAIGKPIRLESAVHSLAYSPDQEHLLIGLISGRAQMWDVANRRPVGSPIVNQGPVSYVQFSWDGRQFLTVGMNEGLRIWDVETQTPIEFAFEHRRRDVKVAFAPDGKSLAYVGGGLVTAHRLEIATGRKLGQIHHRGYTRVVTFSPNGKSLLTGGVPGVAKISRLPDSSFGQVRKRIPVSGVAFSIDGTLMLTTEKDRKAHCWDVAKWTRTDQSFPHGGELSCVEISPNGQIVATAEAPLGYNPTSVKLWDTETGKRSCPPLGHPQNVHSVAFSPDGHTLLTSCEDGNARLWNVSTGTLIGRPLKHEESVFAVAYSPSGESFATGSGSYFRPTGTVRFWNARTRESMGQTLPHNSAVVSLAYSPDGQFLVTGCMGRTAQFWDVTTRGSIGNELIHGGSVKCVAFSPDGQLVATGSSDGIIRLWSVGSRKAIGPSIWLERQVKALAFTPDGKTIVAGSSEDLAGSEEGEFVRQRVPIALDGSSAQITLWIQVITGMEFPENGGTRLLDNATWNARRQQLGLHARSFGENDQ